MDMVNAIQIPSVPILRALYISCFPFRQFIEKQYILLQVLFLLFTIKAAISLKWLLSEWRELSSSEAEIAAGLFFTGCTQTAAANGFSQLGLFASN